MAAEKSGALWRKGENLTLHVFELEPQSIKENKDEKQLEIDVHDRITVKSQSADPGRASEGVQANVTGIYAGSQTAGSDNHSDLLWPFWDSSSKGKAWRDVSEQMKTLYVDKRKHIVETNDEMLNLSSWIP